MVKKIFSISGIVLLLTGFVFTTPPIANAQVMVPVVDPAVVGLLSSKTGIDIGKWALDTLYQTLLATLKKRILDTIVDQTVAWINGETTSPQFVTNFGKTIKDAAQAAFGDTLQEIGAGRLCGPLNFNVQLQLSGNQRTFSRAVTCTLDQVVQNITTFRNDFSQGGWVAYREAMSPQNNRWGMEILVTDQLSENKTKNANAKQAEVQSGGGFLSGKICRQWTLYNNTTGGQIGAPFTPPQGDPTEKIGNPPPVPPGPPSAWKCTQEEVTTPGTVLGSSVAKSIGSDIEYIVNSNDLATYLAAIMDAAINRLIRTGARGLTNMIQSETTTGVTPPPYVPGGGSLLPGAISEYNQGQQQTLNQYRASILAQIHDATSSLIAASQSISGSLISANTTLTALLNTLYTCQTNCLPQLNTTWTNAALPIVASEAGRLSDYLNPVTGIPNVLAQLNALALAVRTATQQQISSLDMQPVTDAGTISGSVTSIATNDSQILTEALARNGRCQLNPSNPPPNSCLEYP